MTTAISPLPPAPNWSAPGAALIAEAFANALPAFGDQLSTLGGEIETLAAGVQTQFDYVQGVGLTGTSTTSITIGTGSKTFTTQSGRLWVVGMSLRISDSTANNLMDGKVTAYTTTSLTVNVTRTEGSGTIASWTIGPVGPAGAVTLGNFTESVNTSAPNATVPAVRLTAANAAANVDFVINPKGTGAILGQTPDNTSTGGNKRGGAAVDLQLGRTAAANVASGASSFIAGYDNLASGFASVAVGYTNIASAADAVAVGAFNTASGSHSIAIGYLNTANSDSSYAFGRSNTASGFFSFVAGWNSVADAQYSMATGGYAATRGRMGTTVFGGQSSALGRSQLGCQILRADTTNATATRLTSDGSAATTSNITTLPDNSAYVCRVRVLAFQTTASNLAKTWTTTVLIRRTSGAATTAIVGTPTVTSDFGDASLSTASVAVSADTTNGGLAVTATGIAATNLRWACLVESLEVTTA